MCEAIGHCLPDRDILKGCHIAVRIHLRSGVLGRPNREHGMEQFVEEFSVNDEWWSFISTTADATRDLRRQIYGESPGVVSYDNYAYANTLPDDLATCLADSDCRHILLAGGHTLGGSWLRDLAIYETTDKITLTDCLPGYIPLNTHRERLDTHRGAPSISVAVLYRYEYEESYRGLGSADRKFPEISQAFRQPFESCKDRDECRHFVCPFSHVCHTEGCIARSEEQPCPGGFTLDQHHNEGYDSEYEREIWYVHRWVRASS